MELRLEIAGSLKKDFASGILLDWSDLLNTEQNCVWSLSAICFSSEMISLVDLSMKGPTFSLFFCFFRAYVKKYLLFEAIFFMASVSS